MAGASDKARFYLEQYVPELQEYDRKEIFTRDQITAIAKKRSDIEHTLNARGSKPSDYARYATYEMNLDTLRKKRTKRLGVKTTTFSGQRTVFFILDRATRKFPGDMGLWMQYIRFCEKEKASKKLAKLFTSVLRLKPTEWGLWVYAAKHYMETQGDMATARSYMQRGLRFCKSERKLWLEYAKLEMVYLAKISARRRILGLDIKRKETEIGDEGEDMIALPEITREDLPPMDRAEANVADEATLRRIAETTALNGGIPQAIFDGAMMRFNDNTPLAEDFFDVFAELENLPSTPKLLQHVLDRICATNSGSAAAITCKARLQLFGVELDSIDFPAALGKALATVKHGVASSPERVVVAEKAANMLLPYLKHKDELEDGVVKVLEYSVKTYLRVLPSARSPTFGSNVDANADADGTTAAHDMQSYDAGADLLERYRDAR